MEKGKIHSSLTVLHVSDLERSKAFYQDVLGCEVTDFWTIRDGLSGLGLKLLQAADPQDVRPNKALTGHLACNVYAYVDDFATLDALYEEFVAKGAPISCEPTFEEFDWGAWKEFAVQDPDGYGIAFGAAKK